MRGILQLFAGFSKKRRNRTLEQFTNRLFVSGHAKQILVDRTAGQGMPNRLFPGITCSQLHVSSVNGRSTVRSVGEGWLAVINSMKTA